MNKIRIVNDDLKSISVNDSINIECIEKEGPFSISEIRISVNKNTSLYIEIDLKKESKLNLNIDIIKDVNLNLNIITKGNTGKVKYTYNLYENSYVNVFKFQNVESIKEMICVKLKEENAKIDYNFKTIGNSKETYDYSIFHSADNTVSNIKNNGVCIDGEIIYQVSSFVPKNINGCIVNQNNRIINLSNNKCEIMPNLYIDSSDVSASHSALIGKFSDDEMFYMQSRGIDYENALKLLITGFLTSDIKEKNILNQINKNINKYWGVNL